ncbi:MAG TPA: ABC transporter permease [Cyclobacteriaceae bacterium]|nr:ABC transporter permease [Cyclobacteriaceae bacterium]
MLKNYLKIAFRSLLRSKTHSIINILGLGIGIACCILIVLFVKDEWTFDTFHTKADRIYRVWAREDYGKDEVFFYTVTPFPMGPTLKDNFAEVEYQVRINNIGPQVKLGENLFSERVTIGGKDFFKVFDFDVEKGDTQTALEGANNVVITKRMAVKYFGESEPINKVLAIQLGDDFQDFAVKAVVKDVPTNSSIQFDILISDLNYPKLYSERALTSGWFNITPETYVLLRKDASASQLEKKIQPFMKTVLGSDFDAKYEVGLQPLTDIHLNTYYPAGIAPVSNPKYAGILAAIALLILIVACINFVTLSVGRSIKRAKEVGIRKVVGAERKHVIFQFIGEAVIVTIISLVVGVLLSYLNLPLFNDLSGKQLVIEANGFMLLVSLTTVLIIGLLAGSYPAFVLSGFRPVTILKGNITTGSSKQGLRKVLVGVQLVLAIFLISSTLVMRDQLEYLQNKDMGFNKEQLMAIQMNVPGNFRLTERIRKGFENVQPFKNELGKINGVAEVFAASHDFGNGTWTQVGFTDEGDSYRTFNLNVIDADYLPAMKIEMVEGRNFSEENLSDKRRSVIVNEALVKSYGMTDPVGKRLPGKNFEDHEIIGVVKDFNYASLYTSVEPLVLVMDVEVIAAGIENINIDNNPTPKLMVRLQPGNMNSTIDEVKSVWDKLTNGEEFAFTFVDDAMAAQYRADQNLGKIISIATILAMLIGGLGLYALASLAMQNRTKEISIRKVMGATEQSLLALLSKDYLYLVGGSLLLSVPMTYFIMTNWLQSFEYKVSISWQVFVFAGGISLVVAIVTISYQAIKTAWSQPAKTLKYE